MNYFSHLAGDVAKIPSASLADLNRAERVLMIGSLRKTNTIRGDLQKEGISDEDFSKLQAPIGLDIGAETPEEIAISISAEIIAAKKGKLERLKK